MAYPFQSRPPRKALPSVGSSRPGDWRCGRCNKLLGQCRPDHVHLSFTRGHEYMASYPVTATCRGCGTLNKRGGHDPAA